MRGDEEMCIRDSLYAVVRSANEVDKLRYRTDKEGRVVFHDRVDIISPVSYTHLEVYKRQPSDSFGTGDCPCSRHDRLL